MALCPVPGGKENLNVKKYLPKLEPIDNLRTRYLSLSEEDV
jgi:hypothetical protein